MIASARIAMLASIGFNKGRPGSGAKSPGIPKLLKMPTASAVATNGPQPEIS